MEHMLASEKEPCFKNRIHQLKYDGSRAFLSNVGGKIKIINRRGVIKNDNFPELLKIKLPPETIVDGEIVYLTGEYHCDFYKLLQRNNTQDKFMQKLLMRKVPVTFISFDILMFKGRDLRELPLRERLEILNKLSGNPEVFRICKSFENVKEIDKLIAKHNLEGKIIKKVDARYVGGRSDLWVKKKVKVKEWFRVVGYKSMRRPISALLLKSNEGIVKGYVNFTMPEVASALTSTETGVTLKDHENYSYKELDGSLQAYVEYCPADITFLREPVLLRVVVRND